MGIVAAGALLLSCLAMCERRSAAFLVPMRSSGAKSDVCA